MDRTHTCRGETMPRRQKKRKWRSAAAHRLQKLAGDPGTVEEAIQIVTQWLLHDVMCPPTDLEALGAKLNVMQLVEADIHTPAQLHEDGDQFYITYSSQLPFTAQRFAIARMIGKAVFHATGPHCPTKGIEFETLCDMLAAEFLMPTEHFERHVDPRVSIHNVVSLSETFETSLTATAIRYARHPFVSVFEVKGDHVVWGHGGVQKGSIQQLDIELRALVESAMESPFEAPQTFFSATKPWFGTRVLEWTSAGPDRVLFLVRLLRREEKESSNKEASKTPTGESMEFAFLDELETG
ncbi:MAG TPA: hypothetical protein DCE42_28590 [Myxococcales bacterium]|nr:hypothetical protein [Myxococcales bacterium]